jgi:preprotein translocase subunit SecG
VNDIGNLFGGTNLGEIFSAAGLAAFLNFPFYKATIFYIFLAETFILIYFMYIGYKQDKKRWMKIRALGLDEEKP